VIHAIAHRIAVGIKNVVPEHPRSVEVLRYAISFLLNATVTTVLAISIGVLAGRVEEVATVLLSFALLRQMSGGIHLQSGFVCIAASTAGATALSFANFNQHITIILTAIAALFVLIYAPSRIERHSRIPRKYYSRLRALSFLAVCSNFVIGSPVIAAAFLLQSMTLIRKRG